MKIRTVKEDLLCNGTVGEAIRDYNPVVFLENEMIYGHWHYLPMSFVKNSVVPICKAKLNAKEVVSRLRTTR